MSYNLNFHQTFKPEALHISKLLTLEYLEATKEEISHRFGIPTGKSSGKVEVSLLYAQAAGFLSVKRKKGNFLITRSSLGKKIHDIDPFLEKETTHFLMHYKFCSLNTRLLLWRALFVDYRAVTPIFTADEFLEFATNRFETTNIKTAPLYGTYISEEPLIDIELLEQDGEGRFRLGNVQIFGVNWVYYAFALFSELITIDSNKNEFTLVELLECGFNRIFGWDSDQLRGVLELFENHELIVLNKQFDNYHIRLNTDLESLIENMN